MPDFTHIPLFPLSILPVPGELVPLHIFEPRYRQLLNDMEVNDIRFGIHCTHELNQEKTGSLMKLESVIKRYKTGESDIIVKCVGIFTLDHLEKTFETKLYPGGYVNFWNLDSGVEADGDLLEAFAEYRQIRGIREFQPGISVLEIASELNLDISDRYKLLHLPETNRRVFILNHLKFQTHIFRQEEKARGIYHLN